MNKAARAMQLVDSIETAFRELLEITGEEYITGFIVEGAFMLYTEPHNGTQALDCYRNGAEKNDNYKEIANNE